MITNYLTIDVEDYFQVAAFEKQIKPDEWPQFESRVNKNTSCILDTLDLFHVKATFFIVGWIAEKHPELVKRYRAELITWHKGLPQKKVAIVGN